MRGAGSRRRADRSPAGAPPHVRPSWAGASAVAGGADRDDSHEPRRSRAQHAPVGGGQGALLGGAGGPRRPGGGGRVGGGVRLAPLRSRGVRHARGAADDGHLRRRRRAALAAGDVSAAPRSRARARKPASRAGHTVGACFDASVRVARGRHGRARDGARRRARAHDSGAWVRGRRPKDDGRLRGRPRRRRPGSRRRRRRRDARVRDGRAPRGARCRARGGSRGDPVRVVGGCDARVLDGRRDASRRLRVRDPARRGRGRARLQLELAEVGVARAGGKCSRTRLRRPLRRP